LLIFKKYNRSFKYNLSIYFYFFQIIIYLNQLIEGNLEVKLPTIWTDEKQSRAEAARRERLEEKESEERRCRCAKR